MSRLYYFAVMFLILLTIFNVYYVIEAVVDVTVIGHVKKWKEISLPKKLHKAPKGLNPLLFGYDYYNLLSDSKIHPQTILVLILGFLIICVDISIVLICIFLSKNIPSLIVFTLDAVLFMIKVSQIVFMRCYSKRIYKEHIKSSHV